MGHRYPRSELEAMELDEVRLVAIYESIPFNEYTRKSDLVKWILQKQAGQQYGYNPHHEPGE